MGNVEAQKEHLWLHQLVGEWTTEMEASMGPDKPPEIHRGTETAAKFGNVWVQCHGSHGNMPDGTPGATIMTLGYDPAKQKFVGSFIGTMMTNIWIYEGSLDDEGRILTLDAEGPSFADPSKLAKYQDKIEIVTPDHRILSSQYLGDDGTWHLFMTAHYRRKT